MKICNANYRESCLRSAKTNKKTIFAADMKLNFKKLGQGRPLIILHGLLGMLDNWQSIGKILSEKYEVFLVDARNHGHSPHSDEFSYKAMAEDILEMMDCKALETAIIIGHSMGGKTAMKFAQLFPERIEKLVVVDMAPGPSPVQHENIFKALQTVNPGDMKSRKEVETALSAYIPEIHILQFLLKNLYWKETDLLSWRFNLESIMRNLEKIREATTGNILRKPSLFLRGERSAYIGAEDIDTIKAFFPLSEIKTIPGAGHWIHAEQPGLFLKELIGFLEK